MKTARKFTPSFQERCESPIRKWIPLSICSRSSTFDTQTPSRSIHFYSSNLESVLSLTKSVGVDCGCINEVVRQVETLAESPLARVVSKILSGRQFHKCLSCMLRFIFNRCCVYHFNRICLRKRCKRRTLVNNMKEAHL